MTVQRTTSILIAVTTLVAMALSVAPSRADSDACPVPSTQNRWEDSLKPEECRLLHRSPDVARREGNRLIVKLVSGGDKTFQDHGDCIAEACIEYALAAIDRE